MMGIFSGKHESHIEEIWNAYKNLIQSTHEESPFEIPRHM
jgi:hypothetical protein